MSITQKICYPMKFKAKAIIIFTLFFSLITNAQIESISLPKGNVEIKVNHFSPIISIYVDSTNSVYLEKELIKVYDISKELLYIRYKMPFEAQMTIKIFLYVDNNADYSTVDEIKTQLASAYYERVYYKTNSIEDKDILKGMSWTNHQSFFHLNKPEKVLTKKEHESQKRLNDSINEEFADIPAPPAPPSNWFFDSQHIIYSDSQNAIDEALEDKIYTCVTLTNEGYKSGNDILTFDKKEKVEHLFSYNDIVFVKFSQDLKYENYFKAVSQYKELDNNRKGFFFELSHEITAIHKKSNIKLCN